ncbi:hypothetical protein FHG87_010107 [Trinorchestia longiramus]|nr:hypothetical protein FHG87_010107 [Trinorchestia longiramus]
MTNALPYSAAPPIFLDLLHSMPNIMLSTATYFQIPLTHSYLFALYLATLLSLPHHCKAFTTFSPFALAHPSSLNIHPRHRLAGGKSKKVVPHNTIECTACKMWVDMESCKGLTEMSESERNKLVFDCWKCMVDEKEKMADVNTKMEEIKRLKAEAVSLTRELEDDKKLKREEGTRNKKKVDGDVNDGARNTSERDEWSRVNEKMNGTWAKVNERRMIEMNGINNRDERNRINEKMNGF